MKKRVLSLALALVMLLALVPTTALAVSADTTAADEFYGGTGYSRVNGGTGHSSLSAAAVDTSVDYCSILGISQATAEKFGETIRESLRNYDFTVELSGLKINVNNTSREKNAFQAMMEHEVFYAYDTFMFGETSYNWNRDNNYNITAITFEKNDTLYSKNDYQTYLTTIHLMAAHLMDGIKGNSALTDLQKALLLHDRLAAWARYDYDNQQAGTCPEKSYSVVGILWDQVGVCQGYAEAYAYMLDQCGIPNRFAQSNTLNHIWNIVKIAGVEYYVDVTWDDPSNYDRLGQVTHDHFLVSLNKLRESHKAYDFSTISQNSTYDTAFWQDSHTEFQLVNGAIYYLDNVVEQNARYATLYRWDKKAQVALLNFNDDGAMKWWWETGYYWTDRNYATMDSWDGKLYVSAAKQIYEYDPVTATWNVCFIPQMPSTYDCIYGFTIWGGRFEMNFYDSWPKSESERESTHYYYAPKSISSIKVAQKPNQSVFKIGDTYDFSGLTLTVKYTDGTSTTVKNLLHGWKSYNTATTGTKTVTVNFYGFSTTFDVKVVEKLSTPKVTVKNADKGVAVSWDKVSNAKDYIVYRSYKSNGSWSSWTKMTQTTGTSYTDTSAKDGKVYRYAVYAYHVKLRSALGKSSEIRRLDTPTVKVSNGVSGTYVSWNKITGATTYAVYRCYRKNNAWTDWKQVGTTSKTTYTDTKASANTVYRYAVKAVNGSQKSASGTTGEIRRLTAATVTAKKSGSTIKLSWTKVTGADYYVVYRRVAGTSTWVKLYSTRTRAYTDKTAKAGKYYEYAVRAVNGKSLSAYKACKKVKR